MKTPNLLDRTPNLNQAVSDSEFINILHITPDLQDSDLLAHSLRSFAPGMKLEASLPDFKLVDGLFRVKNYDLLLLDNRIAATESVSLISHLDTEKLTPAVVAIIGANDKNTPQTLLALSDDSIVRGPNFANRLADLLKIVYVRSRLSIKRRESIPQPVTTEETVVKATSIDAIPESDANAERTQKKGSDMRTFPRKQVDIPCKFKWEESLYTAQIYDLSEEGAFVITSALPRNGDSIHLQFYLGDKEIIQESIVVHEGWYLGGDSNFFGFGTKFCNITENARIAYRKIIGISPDQTMSKVMLTN